MDGVAVTARDTFGAAEDRPVRLRIGHEAYFVDTGDPLPEGSDAVVMIEEIYQVDDETVEVMRAAYPWQHVRTVGEDVVANEVVLPAGHRISPYDMGALVAAGVMEVVVRRRPRVVVIPTGTEVVDPEALGSRSPRPGEVVDFNTTMLKGLVIANGAEFIRVPVVPDEPAMIKEALEAAVRSKADVIMMVAGSSAGSEDHTANLVEQVGTLLVHGVGIMPGKPTSLGMIGNTPFVGLPGYPVSAALAFDLFVVPLLEALGGVAAPERRRVVVVPTRPIPSKLGLEEFVRVKVGRVGERVVATPLPRGAGVITSLTKADAIIRIPDMIEGIQEGHTVEAELLRDYGELDRTVVIIGSHDMAIDVLASRVRGETPPCHLASTHVGSLGGLMALKKGYAHMAGTHLLDPTTGTYNISYIHRYIPDRSVHLIHLARRQQGLLVPPGNPKGIAGLPDLLRSDVVLVNRQKGSGTRVLLDYRLEKENIDPQQVRGYRHEEFTHLSVAVAVASGRADVGLGIYSAARALGLEFIPLEEEDYDLVVPTEFMDEAPVRTVIAMIRSAAFRKEVEGLGGYECTHMGEEQPL